MGGPTRAGGLRLARGAQHAQFDVADRLGFHTRAHLTGAEARPRETGAAPGGACIHNPAAYRSARSLSQIVTQNFETPDSTALSRVPWARRGPTKSWRDPGVL